MPKNSNKRRNKGKKTRKQKPINMIGCSKKGKKSCKNKVFSSLGNKSCPNCGPNCHCGPNCKCPAPCPGNCYLNRRKKQRGGDNGCGCGGRCPIPPLSTKQMNLFGGYNGSYPPNLIPDFNGKPVIIAPPAKGYQPILGVAQNGGSCGSCNQIPVVPQSGGTYFKSSGLMPGPILGSPWGGDPSQWPGTNGVGGDRNYFVPYNTNNDPQLQMSTNDAGYKNPSSMVGGYRYTDSLNKSSPKKRGGGLIPEDLVNLGRDFTFNFKSAYNALNGYNSPVDPAPYKGQLTGALNNNRFLRS